MDPDLLRSTWSDVVDRYGPDNVAIEFYSRLFMRAPHLRPLFGSHMADQRRKLAATLSLVVRSATDLDSVIPILERLGRNHRRFGATNGDYTEVRYALLETLGYYLGEGYTPEVADTWAAAFDTVAGVMRAAAADAETHREPAWWDAPVVHTERTGDRAVIVIDPGDGYPWQPGLLVPATPHGRPGSWRNIPVEPGHGRHLMMRIALDPDDLVSLSLLQIHRGDIVRLGVPVEAVEPVEDQT